MILEAEIEKAKKSGDKDEVAALRSEKRQLRDEELKLRDEKLKLL